MFHDRTQNLYDSKNESTIIPYKKRDYDFVFFGKRGFPRILMNPQLQLGKQMLAQNKFQFTEQQLATFKEFDENHLSNHNNFLEHTHDFETFLKDYEKATNPKFNL